MFFNHEYDEVDRLFKLAMALGKQYGGAREVFAMQGKFDQLCSAARQREYLTGIIQKYQASQDRYGPDCGEVEATQQEKTPL